MTEDEKELLAQLNRAVRVAERAAAVITALEEERDALLLDTPAEGEVVVVLPKPVAIRFGTGQWTSNDARALKVACRSTLAERRHAR